jgi:hypothetical protein
MSGRCSTSKGVSWEASWCNSNEGQPAGVRCNGLLAVSLQGQPGAEAANAKETRGSRTGARADLVPGRGMDKAVGRMVRWQRWWVCRSLLWAMGQARSWKCRGVRTAQRRGRAV